MAAQLLPDERYLGEGRFATLAGTDYTVNVARRVVDAAYMHVMVPSMRPPPYGGALADTGWCPPLRHPDHARAMGLVCAEPGLDGATRKARSLYGNEPTSRLT